EHVNLLKNGESVDGDATVDAGDELALFPPVSGG
ncbi:MoaD/ThiS family protein, partial [Halolamina salina]